MILLLLLLLVVLLSRVCGLGGRMIGLRLLA